MDNSYENSYEAYDEAVRNGIIPRKPIPSIEREKYSLTVEKEEAKNTDNYKEVISLAEKLAGICHSQGKESDAYKLEHEAFVYKQKQIYKDADISVSMFQSVPYAEKLKDAMTKAADQAMELKLIEYTVCFKSMLVRICRAQDKERDAHILECGIYPMLNRTAEIKKNKELTDVELERQCMQWIARKYGADLSEG